MILNFLFLLKNEFTQNYKNYTSFIIINNLNFYNFKDYLNL